MVSDQWLMAGCYVSVLDPGGGEEIADDCAFGIDSVTVG